jgi:GNAT superfamily N-acetyltransferase
MIRRYHPDDLSGASAVFRAAFAAEPWNEEWSEELSEARIRELMSSPQSVGYVCEQDGRIIAVMCGRKLTYLRGAEYVIDEFCVHPELHRSGVGTAVMQYAEAEMKGDGAVGIALMTTKGFPSEKFYTKNGFEGNEGMVFMYRVLDKK